MIFEEGLEQKSVDTCDLNVVDFMRHLMNKFNNDVNEISIYLRSLSFCMTIIIEKYSSNFNKLANMSEYWFNKKIVTKKYSVSDFEENKDLCTTRYSTSIVMLRYMEPFNGHIFWKNLWAREMRGTVLFIHPETLNIMVLSYKLPRGSNLSYDGLDLDKLKNHKDFYNYSVDFLDSEQQDTYDRITNNKDIDIYLSSKADGTLLSLNVYSGDSVHIMYPIIDNFAEYFIKLWFATSFKFFDGKHVVVPSTQGTFIANCSEYKFIITSILCGSNIISRKELEDQFPENLPSKTPGNTFMDAFLKYYNEFYIKIKDLISTIDLLKYTEITINFETICAYRSGHFKDRVRSEYSIEYKNDRFLFLGISFNKNLFYVPHMLFKNNTFKEPLWWKINNGLDVTKMITKLNDLIMSNISKEDFLLEFKPCNKNFKNRSFDYEGFVIYKVSKNVDKLRSDASKDLKVPFISYSKIKSFAFYMSEIPNRDNLDYFINLATVSKNNHFHLSKKLLKLYNLGNIGEKFIYIKEHLVHFLNFSNNSTAMNMLLTFSSSTDKFSLDNFEKKTFDEKCNILLYCKYNSIKSTVSKYFKTQFPMIKDAFYDTAKKYILSSKLWEIDNSEIYKFDIFTPGIRNILEFCI